MTINPGTIGGGGKSVIIGDSKKDKSESYTINFWDSESDTLEDSANVKVGEWAKFSRKW